MNTKFPIPRLPEIRPLNLVIPQIPERPLYVTNPAEHLRQILVNRARAFQAKLDDEHEIGVQITDAATPISFWLKAIEIAPPMHVIFVGHDVDRQRVETIQHHTRPAIAFVAIKKFDEEPRRIGF